HTCLKLHIKWNRSAKQSTCQLNNAHHRQRGHSDVDIFWTFGRLLTVCLGQRMNQPIHSCEPLKSIDFQPLVLALTGWNLSLNSTQRRNGWRTRGLGLGMR
ncbi:hypothetical protein M5D96_010015, partial [Drosophila gunungcola]